MRNNDIKKETILSVTEDYRTTRSIVITAANYGLSTGTIRKMLITAGEYSNDTSLRIALVREEHPDFSDRDIADVLCISQKTVELYSPYKGMECLNDDTDRTEEAEVEAADSGRCGKDVFWKLSKGGRLTIHGSGPMWDYGGIRWGFTQSNRPKWWQRHDGIYVKDVVIESGVTTVGQYAFADLVRLKSVTLADSVQDIMGGAFGGENRLRRVVIPDGVPKIRWDLFYLDILLEEVVIPASVQKIQTYAFHGCMSLKRLYFYGDAPHINETSFDLCPKDNIVVCYKPGTSGWSEMWNGFRTEVW